MRTRRILVLLLLLGLLSGLGPAVRAANTYDGTVTLSQTEALAARFLREELGANTAVVCGILANMQSESGFDPHSERLDVNGKTSYGLLQWNGGRLDRLREWCGENGLDPGSAEAQLRFMRHELEGDESAAWRRMQGIPDTPEGAYTAAWNWARYYERCYSGYFAPRARLACTPYYTTYSGRSDLRVLFFDAGGGSCGVSVKAVSAGAPLGELPVPAWNGNTFLGWYTAASGGSRVTAESRADFASSLTLFARWRGSVPFVRRLYTLCLGREGEEGGVRNWVAQLDSGALSGAEVAASFFGSPEYRSRNQTDAQFVTALYNVVLDRAPDGGGYEHWTGFLAAGRSRCWVFSNFCNCPEFRSLCDAYGIRAGAVGESGYDMGGRAAVDRGAAGEYVTRLYERCLSRSPDAEGLRGWTDQLCAGGTAYGVLRGFVLSPEYRAGQSGDEAFVTMLYDAALGRLADSEGYIHWLSKLRAGQSRESVLQSFCSGAEFRSLCAARGLAPGI